MIPTLLLREHFGDIDDDAFEAGSALIGKGAWEDEDEHYEGDPNAPHPEWDPPAPDDEPAEEPAAEEPEPQPIARPEPDQWLDCGARRVARFAPDSDEVNTIEVARPFTLSI